MRTSDGLDAALRRLGYYLHRARPDSDAPRRRWRVLCLQCHAGWDCDNLEEVRGLLHAIRVLKERGGGDIVWDGDGWAYVELD